MKDLWAILKRWFGVALPPPADFARTDGWELEEQGRCRVYRGEFVAYDADGRPALRLFGRIVEWPGLATDVYLRNPPAALRHHAKGPCLQLVSPDGPWFKLHWERPARDFTDSRTYVEQILDEAFRRNR